MLDFAKKEDWRELEHIWEICFGDPQEYMDFYFSKRFAPSDTLIWREDGKPVSMMTIMNVELAGEKGSYIYAVATLPAYRNRGIVRKLEEFAEKIILSRGGKFSVLVPANTELFGFYEKFGYHTDFFLWEGEVQHQSRDLASMEICSMEEFFRMRRSFMEEIPGAVSHPPAELAYIYEEFERFSGKFYRIRGQYAACMMRDGRLLIRECSAQNPIPIVQTVLQNLVVKKAVVRSPYFFEGAQQIPYGMGKYLADGKSLKEHFKEPLYMSLMLD